MQKLAKSQTRSQRRLPAKRGREMKEVIRQKREYHERGKSQQQCVCAGQFAETDPMIIQQGSQLGPNFRTPIATSMKCFVELVVDTKQTSYLAVQEGPCEEGASEVDPD